LRQPPHSTLLPYTTLFRSYAKRIQSSILPQSDLLAKAFKEYFIYFVPRDIVSGDFYWFSNLKGKFIITVADCTGHGVPGAFMSIDRKSTRLNSSHVKISYA